MVRFLEAFNIKLSFYKNRTADMFKDGISVPGLTLKFKFNALQSDVHFYLFNEQYIDLHDTLKNGLVGEASFIFHRYHEAGVSKIRQNEPGKAARSCDAIVAVMPHTWAITQDTPTETYVHHSHDSNFCPKKIHRYGKMAMEWMEWEASRNHTALRYQFNNREKRFVKIYVPVDG